MIQVNTRNIYLFAVGPLMASRKKVLGASIPLGSWLLGQRSEQGATKRICCIWNLQDFVFGWTKTSNLPVPPIWNRLTAWHYAGYSTRQKRAPLSSINNSLKWKTQTGVWRGSAESDCGQSHWVLSSGPAACGALRRPSRWPTLMFRCPVRKNLQSSLWYRLITCMEKLQNAGASPVEGGIIACLFQHRFILCVFWNRTLKRGSEKL